MRGVGSVMLLDVPPKARLVEYCHKTATFLACQWPWLVLHLPVSLTAQLCEFRVCHSPMEELYGETWPDGCKLSDMVASTSYNGWPERDHEQARGLDQLQPVTVTSVTALEPAPLRGFQLLACVEHFDFIEVRNEDERCS